MELSILAIIVWGEVTFLLAGGLLLALMNNALNQRKGRKSIKTLFEKLKTDRSQRLEQIRQGLAEYGLEGDVLEDKVKEIDLQERKLYQRIATIYRNRSDIMLSRINVAVERANRPYYELDLQTTTTSTKENVDADAAEQDTSELEKLRKQNEQLQQELSVTMDTIGRMLSEYSSMFDTEEDVGLDKNKIMQAFNVDEAGEEIQATEEVPEVTAGSDVQEGAVEQDEAAVPDIDEALGETVDVADEAVDTDELLEIDDVAAEPEVDTVVDDLEASDDVGVDEDLDTNDDLDVVVDETQDLADIPAEDEVLPEDSPQADDNLNASGDLDVSDDLDVVIDETTDEKTVASTDVDVPDDELLEIDDELPEQVMDDDLDVVVDDSIPDLEAIISEADQVDNDLPEADDDLLNSVTLDEKDVADLEAAGLKDIVDLDTNLADELLELEDDGMDVPELSDEDKKRRSTDQESAGQVDDIDDLDIDQLLDANKNG